MSKLTARLQRLEEKHAPKPAAQVFVYYHDREKGYSEKWDGPYFETLEDLAAAQGWTPRESDTLLEVGYASQNPARVFIPYNGRD